MREPLLDCSLSPPAARPAPDKPLIFRRREFLQAVGAAGIGLALARGDASAMITSAGIWRECVVDLVYNIFDDYRAQVIKYRLDRATLEYAPTPRTFHTYYSAPFVFVESIEQQKTARCENGFEVSGFPLYSIEAPCKTCHDLNSAEIKRITNDKEIEYYRCVVSPVGERRRWVDRYDHANFANTIKNYPYDPHDYNVEYVRDFRSSQGTCPGFYITSKSHTGPGGKPMGDMLLGELNRA